ncbi:MAG: NFACT RNA binding domain-containing protein [Sphingomonadales bacterium]
MQYASALTYQIIGCFLKQQLQGARLIDAFSSHKDALLLVFKTADKRIFQLLMQFVDGNLYFLNPENNLQPGRKSIRQFKALHGMQITDVVVFENERLILIQLEANNQLLIKGFGRMSNVLMLENDISFPTAMFRLSLKNDRELNVNDLLGKANQVQCAAIPNISIFSDNSKLFDKPADGSALLGTGAEGLFAFARDFVKNQRKKQTKQQWESHWLKQISMHKARIIKLKEQIAEIESRRSYRELGDIVLAHVHQIKKGVGTALLQDFFTNKPIRIKLNPDMDAAENAARFYRKAKNEGLEKSHLLDNLSKTEFALHKAESELHALLSTSGEERIKPLTPNQTEKQPEGKPYKLHTIDGFEVWIGKSAADNDNMLKLASKQDLWLHVRGYAGSHVIIKKKGPNFPESVIQKAAELAARNSKAKTQKMVPVIYTERRYVSKPRNAAPGEVAVLKEKVTDVYLK